MLSLSQLILPLIILIPFLFIIPVLVVEKRRSFIFSIVASIIVFILALTTIYLSSSQTIGFSVPYISYLNVNINFQVTHINLILLLMTSIVFLAASIVGEYFIKKEERQYNLIFLIAEGASIAMFLSGNLFLFYVFWEISEVMMFFMIFVYGGYARKYAAVKFIIYSLASSLFLLIAIMLIYTNVTPNTFNISTIISNSSTIPQNIQLIAFSLLLISFIIKMPVFPLHTWLPDAHTEAPTTGSMILAGVLLKFGGYGLILAFLMLPIANNFSSIIALLFGFSAVYAAFVALKQSNIKRAIAYTSIVDMGIVAIGIAASNSLGSDGALYAMLAHGIVVSLLFLIAGTLGELYGTMEKEKITGVIKNFPYLTYLFIFGAVALVGIPLTSNFIGDLLIFTGSLEAFGIVGLIPLVSLILLGALMFWIIETVFLGRKEVIPYHVLDGAVRISGIILALSTVILGLFPFILLHGV